MIQKAAQGTSFTDPTFAVNRQKAADAGLLFGAYHFGVSARTALIRRIFSSKL